MQWVIVILFRLLVPLTIFRWPFFGSLLALIADNLDVVILDYLGVKDFGLYNPVDKSLDIYYHLIQGYVSLRWSNLMAKRASLTLLGYRIVGVILYELTQFRILLFIFPNVYELFFLFYTGYKRIIGKDPFKTLKSLIFITLLLTIPKLFQEYMLHITQFPIYMWIKENIFVFF